MKNQLPPIARPPSAPRRRPAGRLPALLLAACLLPAPALAHAAPRVHGEQEVTLNFVNAEIPTVARAMAAVLKRNIVIDPRVRGSITLDSEHAVPPAEALRQFLAALRLSGYTMIEDAGLYKILPEAEAKNQAARVVGPGMRSPANGQIATQIFRLNYASASSLVPVLRPLISPNNTINVGPADNTLIITDYAGNLGRIARIVAALDVPEATDVDVIALRYALADDLAPLVQRLLGSETTTSTTRGPGTRGAAARASGAGYAATVLADKRNNTLVLRAASAAQIALARAIVLKLDAPPAAGTPAAGDLHVIYLRNADAVTLAPILRAALASSQAGGEGNATSAATTAAADTAATPHSTSSATGSSTSTADAAGGGLSTGNAFGGGSAGTSTGGPIQADATTNSLVISAPEPVFRQLRAIVDQLDERRAQVYVEALIAEVSSDKGSDLGVQWLGLAGNSSSHGYIGGTSSFGTAGNVVDLAAAIHSHDTAAIASNLSQGLTLGLYKGSLAVLANALETRANANILSTPTLTTLDNQEARILIGQNIPVATGAYSSTASTSTVTPFTTYDRIDVGLTLDIRPQINADGSIKMQIYQEVSSVAGSLGASSTGTDASNIVTNKRTLNTTVQVQDGDTIVLGGLMQDKVNENRSQVPLLGDIPFLGALFRSHSVTRSKTNLMIFLRPVVLRSATSTSALSLDRYDSIRAVEQALRPTSGSNAEPGAPELPPIAPAPAAAQAAAATQAATPTPVPTPAAAATSAPAPTPAPAPVPPAAQPAAPQP